MLILLDTKKVFNNYQSILLHYYKKCWKMNEWTIEIVILRYENSWINVILCIVVLYQLISIFMSIYKVRDQNTKCWKTRWHVAPIGMPR